MGKLRLSKIGIKTALYVGLAGIILTALQSAVVMYVQVKNGVEQSKITTRTMLESSSSAASNVVFEMNERAADKLIDGLLLLKYITMGSITDELGYTLAKAEKENHTSNISNTIVKLLNIEDELIILPLTNPRTNEPEFGKLSVRISSAALMEPLLRNAKLYFFCGFIDSLLIILFLWMITYFYISNPLKTLLAGVNKIGDGFLENPIEIKRKDELGELAAGVNKMANQLKQSFDDLRLSEMKYRDMVENLNDVIYATSEAGVITYISPAIKTVAGYDPDEVIGRMFSDFFYIEDLPKIIKGFKQILAGKRVPHEYRLVKKSGEPTWIRTSSRPIIENGRAVGVCGVLLDINVAKGLEAQLRQAQKMDSIGTLAGGIAHDFNNLLNSMSGYVDGAREGTIRGEDISENLDGLQDAASRARNLVKHILTFSRQAGIEKQPTAIRPLIRETLKFIRTSIPATIEIDSDLGNKELMVLADPTQIHHVIMNLCTNAANAMEDKGGKMNIGIDSLEITEEDALLYKDIKGGSYLRLTISDTGSGIDERILGQIFDPFFTTKERVGGTGLGLSVTHGIVKEMGGAISVDSEAGKGTTFKILLPAFEVEVSGEISEQSPAVKSEARLLFVDDEKPVVDSIKQMLKHMGYDVISTMSSTKAFEIFKAQPDSFDLVLTDMTMPEMTGFELSKKIKEIRPDIPIILCTGYSFDFTETMLEQKGISHIVMKPIIPSKLAASINAVLLRSKGATAPSISLE